MSRYSDIKVSLCPQNNHKGQTLHLIQFVSRICTKPTVNLMIKESQSWGVISGQTEVLNCTDEDLIVERQVNKQLLGTWDKGKDMLHKIPTSFCKRPSQKTQH